MFPHRHDPNPLVAWTLWCDGVFELALGCLLASAPLTGLLAGLQLASPASPPLVVGVGLALLPVGIGLVVLSQQWTTGLVVLVATLNTVGGFLFAAWLARAWADFAPPGRLLTGGVALGLALLAVAELGALQRQRARTPAV